MIQELDDRGISLGVDTIQVLARADDLHNPCLLFPILHRWYNVILTLILTLIPVLIHGRRRTTERHNAPSSQMSIRATAFRLQPESSI
jgi:hypothetical protein